MKITKNAFYLVMLFSFFWAVRIIIDKFGLLQGIHPFVLSTQIISVGFIILIIYNISINKDKFKQINKKNLMGIIISGIVGSGVANIFAYVGLNLSTSINFGFLIKTTLIFTILLSWIFLKEKLSNFKIILGSFLLVGAYLITTGGTTLIPHIGDIFIILAALFYTIGNIIARAYHNKVHADIFSVAIVPFALLVLVSVTIISGQNVLQITNPIIIIAGGFAYASTQIFLLRSFYASTASYVTMMSMITPIYVFIFGILVFKEPLNLFHILGGLIILISGILISRTDIHKV